MSNQNGKPKRRSGPKGGYGKRAKERDQRKRLAQETLEVLETGFLLGHSIQDLLDASSQGTRSYPEGLVVIPSCPKPARTERTTRFSVVNTTTLNAARTLLQEDPTSRVAVLNFASAKNPGGGFLNGAMAQEESLALHSGLYACLKDDKMYDHHGPMKGGTYSDWCIFSPDVPVFRDERTGELLETPWPVSVITCPCLNRSALKGQAKPTDAQAKEILQKRIYRFLSVLAAHHGSGNLVLGAWGCGVFGNDPGTIASLFAEALLHRSKFRNRWSNVVFAVLDSSKHRKTITPFEQAFNST